MEAGPQEPILEGISELLIAALDSVEIGGDVDQPLAGASVHELHSLRRALLKDNPELFALRMASMHQFEDALSVIVQRRLEHDQPRLAEDPETLHQRARLVTYVSLAGMRHAWSCWADHGGVEPLGDRLRTSFAELQALGNHMR